MPNIHVERIRELKTRGRGRVGLMRSIRGHGGTLIFPVNNTNVLRQRKNPSGTQSSYSRKRLSARVGLSITGGRGSSNCVRKAGGAVPQCNGCMVALR